MFVFFWSSDGFGRIDGIAGCDGKGASIFAWFLLGRICFTDRVSVDLHSKARHVDTRILALGKIGIEKRPA